MLSLITAQASAIPLRLEVLDGNSDKTSFRATLTYCQQLGTAAPAPRFVMDSAAYARENLEAWQAINWLTRVPETVAAVKALKRRIATDDMTAVSEGGYRIYPVTGHYAEVAQRWLLVYSEQAYVREHKRLLGQVEAGSKATSALKKLSRQAFNCQADAKAAAAALAKQCKWHKLSFELLPDKKFQKPGRPPKDAVPKQIGWLISGSLSNDTLVTSDSPYLGRFVLATNELGKATLPDEHMLSQYKQQSSSVERGFRFLRAPMVFADSLFVKSPLRIMAMTMMMGLALLV